LTDCQGPNRKYEYFQKKMMRMFQENIATICKEKDLEGVLYAVYMLWRGVLLGRCVGQERGL
jgi:hypothetical protein